MVSDGTIESSNTDKELNFAKVTDTRLKIEPLKNTSTFEFEVISEIRVF